MSSVPSKVIDGYSETHDNRKGENGIGFDTEVTASESTDNLTRREVWNRPVAAAAETGIVIGGADLWPSLSEGVNTRHKPSYRTVPEASSSRNNVAHSARPNSTHNGTRSGSNRQPKNNAARASVGNGERSQHQHQRPSSQGPVFDVSSNNGSHNGNSQSDAGHNNGPRPQLHSGGNHPHHRDSNRRGNGGPHRGDGSHGRRRNGDRDANAHPPNYNGRNGPVQPPVFPGPFPVPVPRPSLPVVPYPPPPPPPFPPMPFMAPGIHPFAGGRMFYGPPVGPIAMRPHPRYVQIGPPIVMTELLKQIDYYFSDENLVRDVHLRKNMDEYGWVMVTLIAEFKKVKQIIAPVKPFLEENEIDPLRFIQNAMLNSYHVEVQGNKLRKRIDWKKYILRNIGESSSTAAESRGESSSTAAESHANGELAAQLENTVIEEEAINNDSKPEAEDKATDDQAGQQPS